MLWKKIDLFNGKCYCKNKCCRAGWSANVQGIAQLNWRSGQGQVKVVEEDMAGAEDESVGKCDIA